MAKEFNKKFMHPTRRKLVDMVLTGGDYQKEAFVSFAGADKEIIKRKVGEKWTDENGKVIVEPLAPIESENTTQEII